MKDIAPKSFIVLSEGERVDENLDLYIGSPRDFKRWERELGRQFTVTENLPPDVKQALRREAYENFQANSFEEEHTGQKEKK